MTKVFVEQPLALPGCVKYWGSEIYRPCGSLFLPCVTAIQTNELRSYGSKLVEKTSYVCPEQCPKLDVQLPRNNLCCAGGAESVAWSVREYSYQLVSVLSLVSVHNR